MKKILISALVILLISNISYAAKSSKYENYNYEYNKTIQTTRDYLKSIEDNQDSQLDDMSDFLTLLNKAQRAEQNKDYYAAMDYYDKMIEIAPKNSAIYALRGMLYLENLDFIELAIEDYTNAIKYNPNESKYYTMRGIARMRYGDKDGAFTDLTKAINMNKQKGTPQALPYCIRGLVNTMKRNEKAAIEDTTQSIKLQPKNPQAFHYRGLAKMGLAVEQLSMPTMDSGIQDLNYAKEQCLQLGDMAEYQKVLESYKMVLTAKQVLERELNKNKGK